MEKFNAFIENIPEEDHRVRVREVLDWVRNTFPHLKPEFKWNQPMFTDHGTFIIGFSVAKKHIAVAPEFAGMEKFRELLKTHKIESTKMLIRFPFNQDMNYGLLKEIIEFNIEDKQGITSFWR